MLAPKSSGDFSYFDFSYLYTGTYPQFQPSAILLPLTHPRAAAVGLASGAHAPVQYVKLGDTA